ncbi:WxL domain-containing protein [Enterococcus rotai]|uniref:WxL domain-containing protein n=1 Tax=Enterococcus rotai TaxID=118060 RepID=UPI0035C6C8BE
MKKGLLATLFVTAGVLTLSLGSTNAHAEDNTDLKIEITPDGGVTPGKDPLAGKLAIAYIPTNMDFGKNANTGDGAGVVNVFKDTIQKSTFIAVSDDRPDAERATKWDAVAKLSDFTVGGSTADADKLANAKLEFTTGAVQELKVNRDTDDNLTSVGVPTDPTNLTAYSGKDIANTASVQIDAGGSTKTVLSRTNASLIDKGAFATEIKDRQLRVALPQSQAGKTFTAQLTWSLANVK